MATEGRIKESGHSALSPADHGKQLLLDFAQAVEYEYCRQNSTPQLLKWSSVESLVKKLRLIEKAPIQQSQRNIFFEYLLQYLEISLCFVSSFEEWEYKKQKHYATVLLSFVPNFFKEQDLKNAFIAEATAKTLDLFMYGDYSTVSKTFLLRMFNEIATQSAKQVRINTAESMSYYMYKLIDSLSTYGDYMIQSDIMETMFRIFGSQIRNSRIKYELLPGLEELGRELVSDISAKDFDKDVRRWLNKFNSDSQLIFSLPCKTLMFGNTVCKRPDDDLDVMWVDFNMKENTVSFYSGDSGSDQWNRIIIMTKDVKKVEVNRQFTSTENKDTTVFMHLSKPCISGLIERQEYWNSLDKLFKIIISNDEKERITKLISQVLPRLFGDTFSHSSARISGRLKPVYKPLKISKKRSTHSDLSSPSVTGTNACKSPVAEIKQSDLKMDLVEDNMSEVVTDFTRFSSRRSGITSGRASLLSPSSEMFMDVSPTPDMENSRFLQEIEKIQDNIVTSSHGAGDETLASTRIEILSGQSTGSRPVSLHENVSVFHPSQEFSSTPVKISRHIRQFSDDEFLGEIDTVEQHEKEAPAAQKMSTFTGAVETVEQPKPSHKNDDEEAVAMKISILKVAEDVETVKQLKPSDKNDKDAAVAQKISTSKAAEDVDKNPDDLCEDEFFSAEIGNAEQKINYIDKVKENYVMKVSALIASEDFPDDEFETAVENLNWDDVESEENNQSREATDSEIPKVSKKRSQFVGDNLQNEVIDLSGDDAPPEQPDAKTKISHYHFDTNTEQSNKNHHNNVEELKITVNESVQIIGEPAEKNTSEQTKLDIIIPPSSANLSQDTSDSRNYKQNSQILTPDLFDLSTVVSKVETVNNYEENYSQNDSEDIFSRPTQENTKVNQRSQSPEQNFTMLSLAVNVGISEDQYSENVATLTEKPNKKSRDNVVDLTLDDVGDNDVEIMKLKADLVGKVVLSNEPRAANSPVQCQQSENVEVVEFNEKGDDNVIDLTMDEYDAGILARVPHKTDLAGNVAMTEPLLNTPELFGILASKGSEAAGTELTPGPDKGDTSQIEENAQVENLAAKKRPRTLIKTGKKQFRLEDLTDTAKSLEEKISPPSNQRDDEVNLQSRLDLEEESNAKPVTDAVDGETNDVNVISDENCEKIVNVDQPEEGRKEPDENSDSDIEWAPEMNADNMDFIETFDKIKEMEEQKHSGVEGSREIIGTETLIDELMDREKRLTQTSGISDFIQKKPARRIDSSSDSEFDEKGEKKAPLLKNNRTLNQIIENESKIANIENIIKAPELIVKISKVMKRPKELGIKKREKTRPPLKEITQVDLEQNNRDTVQKDIGQVPQSEAACGDKEPDRDGAAGDEVAKKETEKSKKSRPGSKGGRKKKSASSLDNQDDEIAKVSMRKAEPVPEASSDKQVAVSLVEREKRDSSPEVVHNQNTVTMIAQVHCVDNEQQNHDIVSQKPAEQHAEPAKDVESPILQPVQNQTYPASETTKIPESPFNFSDSPNFDFGQAPVVSALKQNENVDPPGEKSDNAGLDSDLVPRKRSPILTRNKSKEPVIVKSPEDVIVTLENNDLFDEIQTEKNTTARTRKLWRPGSYTYLDNLLDGQMKSQDSDSLPIAIEKGTKIPKEKKSRTKKKKEDVELSEKKTKTKEKTPGKSTKEVVEGVKKRKPRKRKEFSLSTTNFKSLNELFDMTCKDLTNRPCGYNYSLHNKTSLGTPLDIAVRSAPRNSSSDESPGLTKFLDKKRSSPEETAAQSQALSSEYSWPELEVVPSNTNAAGPQAKINILQDIVIKPKRPSVDDASSSVIKKPRLDVGVAEDVDNVPLPALPPEIMECTVENATNKAKSDEDFVPYLLNILRFTLNLVEARHDPNSIQKLKRVSNYINQP